MDQPLRAAIALATQELREGLQDDFRAQLDATFDVGASGTIAAVAGSHLSEQLRVTRSKIVAVLEYHQSAKMTAAEAVERLVRDAAFTTLNRFVALRMLEARGLVQQCVSAGADSVGYREFVGLA